MKTRRMVDGSASGAYVGYAGLEWYRYGHPRRIPNPQLDRFLPEYEVVERHQQRVDAPAEIAFAAACGVNLEQEAVIRALFRTRELVLGAEPEERKAKPLGLVEQAKAWGWGVLAEEPGREIVFGAVTQPWLAQPGFRALPSAQFAAFMEPGYVKIAWTLCVDGAVVSTETRAVATDPVSRARFRRYWALASPGIRLIRLVALRLVKKDAERLARARLLP